MSDGDLDVRDLKRWQSVLGITGHLIFFGEDRFYIAHTDAERSDVQHGFDLERDCRLHQWAAGDTDAFRYSGLHRLDESPPYGEFPRLVELPVFSRSPNPRPKLVAGTGYGDRLLASAHNAMIDEIEKLSAALVVLGVDPAAVVGLPMP